MWSIRFFLFYHKPDYFSVAATDKDKGLCINDFDPSTIDNSLFIENDRIIVELEILSKTTWDQSHTQQLPFPTVTTQLDIYTNLY